MLSLSPASNTEQTAFTLKFVDVQSIGIPVDSKKKKDFYEYQLFFDKNIIIPSKSKSIALPVQNGVRGLNINRMASDIIGSSGFRFTFTANASEFNTNFLTKIFITSSQNISFYNIYLDVKW